MIGRVALGIAVLALVVGLGLAIFFGDELRTLASFRRVDDYPLYVMHYLSLIHI